MDASGSASRRPPARAYAIGAALLVLAGVVMEGSSRLLATSFPDAPVVPDTLFGILPYVRDARHVTMIAMIAGGLLFANYTVRVARDRMPEYMAVIAIMYLLRAALVLLTPLAHARGEGPPTAFPLFINGMFPSGHTAAALLFFWLTDAGRAPVLRRAQLALFVVVVAGLLISHGHYSIDIVGGALLAYFVHREWTRGRLFGPLKRLMSIA